MDATAFKAALETVEQDHQLVLDQVQSLKGMVTALLEPRDLDVPRVFGRLRELDNYFTTQLATHLDEEDRTLFPLLDQFPPEGPALAERLREEHTKIRSALFDFSSCLGLAVELQERPPEMVLSDLLLYAWDLWDLLDRHAHAETQGIRDCLARRMKERS